MSSRGRSLSPRPLRDEDVDMDSRSPPRNSHARVVIVTNLTRNVAESHLQTIFGFYGELVKVDLPVYGKSGQNRGKAALEYADAAAAQKAFSHMDGGQIDGAIVKCELSELPVRSRSYTPSRSPPARALPVVFAALHRVRGRRLPVVVLADTDLAVMMAFVVHPPVAGHLRLRGTRTVVTAAPPLARALRLLAALETACSPKETFAELRARRDRLPSSFEELLCCLESLPCSVAHPSLSLSNPLVSLPVQVPLLLLLLWLLS
ncbi:hypothetical protein FKP32DRAFT_1673589 [Trametes sanguinea]|nr:hypothetical protein FKP32DRAFT_1673589 [Trametes sanguinea]